MNMASAALAALASSAAWSTTNCNFATSSTTTTACACSARAGMCTLPVARRRLPVGSLCTPFVSRVVSSLKILFSVGEQTRRLLLRDFRLHQRKEKIKLWAGHQSPKASCCRSMVCSSSEGRGGNR